MNVEIGAEAALFPEKEYISGIFIAVHNSIYPGCGVVNPLGVTATSTRIMGVNTSTSTLFGEFPWMVAILEKTDTGSSR
jgi:hypothetical protein